MNLPGYASKTYTRAAQETVEPRELEARLLLKAAAKLQAVLEEWHQRPPSALSDACYTIVGYGLCPAWGS